MAEKTVKNHRVFITGIGVTSPMGNDKGSHVSSMQSGSTHFKEIDFFDVSRQRVKTAGLVDVPSFDHNRKHKLVKRLDRGGEMLLHATSQAMTEAAADYDDGIPYVIGTSAGAMPIGESYYRQAVQEKARRVGQYTRSQCYQAQKVCAMVQEILGFRGQTQIISNACASGANAIGHAFHLVKTGQSKTALAGGYDALAQMVFAGFDSLQAMSISGIPRPFDAHRDGLAIGEAAAMMVIESEESLLARNATPLAEIVGYGMSTDLHHLTQPHPEGSAAVTSMSLACRTAGVAPSEIQYLNSHGTGTPLNDVAEAKAISQWAGENVSDLMVSSTKSAMGHALGGAGAIESALCVYALQESVVPASLNVREVDQACEFDLVRSPRSSNLSTVLTNSFGFGGCNASLIFKHV